MTQIAFHFGAGDRIAYSCRLLRKIAAGGLRALVVTEPSDYQRLDDGLWSISLTDFITHTDVGGEQSIQRRSSVLVCAAWPTEHPLGIGVLVNLGSSFPAHPEWFGKVVEVVSADGADRESARDKWRLYRSRGYDIQRHDLQGQGGVQ